MKKLPIKLSLILGITVALLAVVFWVGLMVGTSPAYADDDSAPADSGAAPSDSGATDSGSVTATDETAIVDETAPVDEATSGDEVAPTDEAAPVDGTTPTEANTEESHTVKVDVVRDSPSAATLNVASGAAFSVTFRVENDNTSPADTGRTNNGGYSLTYSNLTLLSGPATSGTYSLAGSGASTTYMWDFQAPTGPATGSITLSATVTSVNPFRVLNPNPPVNDVLSDSASYTVNVQAPPQYYLTVVSPYGTTGGEGWYDAGATANFSISPTTESGDPGTQYVFTGWTGSGTGSYTGPNASSSIIMNNPITETANWMTQYQLTMATNFGTTSPSVGDHWYDAGSVVTISATAPSAGVSEQYVWNGWTGSGTISYSSTDNPATDAVTMNSPVTETASWTHQYYLTVTSPYGTTGGEGWYNDGDTAYATVDPLTVPGYVFTNWSGDATGNTSPSDAVTMNAPKTAIAMWTSTPAPLGGSVERMLVINWFGIVRAYLVNEAGVLLENVYITSPDGNATLVIPAGTLVLDINGLPLYLHPNPDIIAGMAGTPLAPPGTTIAAVYECLPSDITFERRDAQLIVRYDSAMVAPRGVVVIAYYDEASGSWVELETAGYVVGGEEVPNTVISSFSHFTYFALLIKSPAT